MKYVNAVGAIVLGLLVMVALQRSPEPPDDTWFEHAVTRSSRPVLVKFGADWCPPCRQTDAVLDHASGQISGKVKVVRINIDEKPHLAAHYGIHGIPQVYLFREGRIIARHGGFVDPEQVKNWVDRSL